MILLTIIIANLIISLISLAGVFFIVFSDKILHKIISILVAVAAGTMLGGAFLHLIPESIENLDSGISLKVTLISFIVFFLIEKIFHWHHTHDDSDENPHIHAYGYLNIIGDSIHNFIDGIVIAAAFLTDFNLGIITATAILFHEIPQEIGDLAILIKAGFARKKAVVANLLTAFTAILGGIIGYYLSFEVSNSLPYLLAFAAGGFLYIATSDLIPELNRENNKRASIRAFIFFIIGIGIMYFL